jgi:hypothetical protein
MVRASELAKQLLALEGDPYIAVPNSLGKMGVPEITNLEHDGSSIFDKQHTMVIQPSYEKTLAAYNSIHS